MPTKAFTTENCKGILALANIDAVQTCVANKSAMALVWEHEGQFTKPNEFVFNSENVNASPLLLDLFTASAILAVYNHVNEANKAKMARMIKSSRYNLSQLASFSFKHVS